MHVLLVSGARGIPLYGPSGASSHLRGVAGALIRAGHRVTVLVPALVDPRGAHGLPVAAHVIVVPAPKWPSGRVAREAAEQRFSRVLMTAAPNDVDLVWERHSVPCDGPMRWCADRGIPRWLEVNAPLCLERAYTDPLGAPGRVSRIEAESIRTATRCLVVSRWLIPWARALGSQDVRYLPNGTQTLPLPRDLSAEPVVAFYGSCQPWHRLDRLPTLLAAIPQASAWVVGDGPAPPPRHPRITHTRSGPATALAAAHVGVVLGGHPWVNPLKIADYRALGMPVVSVPFGDAANAIGTAGAVAQWGPDYYNAVSSWFGKTVPPFVRTWDDVVREALATSPG